MISKKQTLRALWKTACRWDRISVAVEPLSAYSKTDCHLCRLFREDWAFRGRCVSRDCPVKKKNHHCCPAYSAWWWAKTDRQDRKAAADIATYLLLVYEAVKDDRWG